MTGATETLLNPYVGPRAFEEGEQQFFTGRDEEIAILEGLAMARRASLLFAQSGAGKSSLLRAGLIPELTRPQTVGHGPRARVYRKMRVLPIATVGGAIPGDLTTRNIYVLSALLSLRPDADAGALAGLSLRDGLAPVLAPVEMGPADVVPSATLLIFDQFEELFTHHSERWPEREDFFRQVAGALETNPDLHVLFSMREDYIAELTPYASLLPEQLRPRFRLERLNRANALNAVTLPATRAGRTFAEGVAEALVDNLRRTQTGRLRAGAVAAPAGSSASELGGYVEPVHLQIVCRQLWASLPPERTVIQAADVQEFGDVDQALTGFYESVLADATQGSGVSERRLRTWFDEHLITPAHTRGLVYRGEAETEGLPNGAADVLNDAYIIRASMRGGDTWYELAHDRLVEPILGANRAWMAAYHNPLAAAAQAWQKAGGDSRQLLRSAALEDAGAFAAAHPGDVTEEEARFLVESVRQAEQVARRRRNLIIAAVSVILVLSGLTIWALRNAAEAHRQALLSRSRELAAAATANLVIDPEQSILWTLQALNTADTSEAEDALHSALQASRVELDLAGHTGPLHDVAFSPDGKRIATASADGTARVWDAASGRQVAAFPGHDAIVYAVAFSPDGKHVASAGFDGTARIWDATSGEEILVLGGPDGHQGQLYSVAYSPDGTLIATTSIDRTAKLWDAATGKLVRTLAGHTGEVWAAAFSPDGTRLATASQDGTAIVWDVASGEQVLTLSGHTDAVSDVAFSPDGSQLATASYDETARIWDATTGEWLSTLYGHTNWVRGVAFSPDGAHLATSSWDRTAKVWDIASGRELMTLVGHKGWLLGLAFSPDGMRLATAGEDGVAKIWNVAPSQELLTLVPNGGAAVEGIAFSPDGARLATAGSDGTIGYWDARNGAQIRSVAGHALPIRDLAFGTRCSGQETAPAGTPAPAGQCPPILATGSEDRTAQVWDAATGEAIPPVFDHNVTVTGVAINPDGTRLATSGSDGKIRIWQIGSDAPPKVIDGHGQRVATSVAFSPDGRWLASAGGDNAVKIWDAASAALIHTLGGHDGAVYQLAFSPDSKRLATAGIDQTARVWDVASGQELVTLRGHTDRVTAVAFSPDGERLATASWDRTAKLWDAETGALLLTLVGHTNKLRDVAFSNDGKRLVTAAEDGTVRFYLLDIEELKTLARKRIARQLTDEECRQYFGEAKCSGTPAPGSTP